MSLKKSEIVLRRQPGGREKSAGRLEAFSLPSNGPAALAQPSSLPAPLAFDGLVGWLHPARGRRGVIVCNGLGYQALNCRPALRALADSVAFAGLPCLRFDYPSEGDSLGEAADPGRVSAWIDSVVRSIDHFRLLHDVKDIALVGLGFGAIAALEAAARRRDIVRHLVLLAPPASGRALVRQYRADALMIGAELGEAAENEAGDLSIAGFALTRETLDDLGKLKLPADTGAQRLLVLAPNGAAPPALAGIETATVRTFSGFSPMMAAKILPRVPVEDWRGVVDWLVEDAPSPASFVAPPPASGGALSGQGFREAALRFGAGGGLAGVMCEPAAGWNDCCALIVNTGANSHVGWARSGVGMSRRLAAGSGLSALRMDLRGVGESAVLPGGARDALYDVARAEDIGDAIAFLNGRGYRRIILVGQCSGAYLALHAALRDARVQGLVLANLVRFVWGEGETIEQAMAGYDRSTDGYVEMIRSGEAWRRLARGEAPLRGVARALRKFGARGARAIGEAAACVFRPRPRAGQPEAWLHELAARGVETRFIFSKTDNGLDEFARFMGRGDWRVRRIKGLAKIVIGDADHNLTSAAAQAALLNAVVDVAKSGNFSGDSRGRAGE